MSGSTRSKKAANDNAEPKPLLNKKVYSLLNSLCLEVLSLRSERVSDTAEMQSLRLALSSPPTINNHVCPILHMTDLCRSHIGLQTGPIICNKMAQILPNGSQASTECFASLSTQRTWSMTSPPYLTIALRKKTEQYPIRSTRRFPLTLPCASALYQPKLQVVRDLLDLLVENRTGQHKPNSTIILSLRKTFGIFKKLGVDGDELEGLLAQAACHPPASLDWVAFNQLVTCAILAKGDKKPFQVRLPPEHLVDWFGGLCFHCGCACHWQDDCPHTKGFANPNLCLASPGPFQTPCPGTPDCQSQPLSSPQYQRERVSQVKFVEHDAVNCVLIDTGASIHLSGSARFSTNLKNVAPFCIFFADSNSSITISQMVTLKIPIRHGFMIIQDVPFSTKILGTILSISRLCRVGVIPFCNALLLSLLVCNILVTTTFLNDCWWIDVVSGEETIVLVAETSSPCFFEMNQVSLPQSTNLSSGEWHEQLGHACDKVVISFLKQHVPTFNIKTWQTFYCPVCVKAKKTHQLAKAHTDIPKQKPLELLVLDVLGPFEDNVQGFQYLLKVRDHVLTYSIVNPIKSQLDAPAAILDAIKQLQVRNGLTPKALRTNNTQELTLASFTNSLAVMGITFCPLLPYLPQENSKAECLNRTLGDMARAMVVQGQMPSCFWQFAYTSSSFIHNRIPNSHCPKSSPHQELFRKAPSIVTLCPHGTDAVVHIPAVHQHGKLRPWEVDCKLLRELMSGGSLLWDQHTNKMVQSASVIFPQFQASRQADTPAKGSLTHIMNTRVLGEVTMEQYFEEENQAIASLPLVKDVKILNHSGQALSGPHRNHWRTSCLT
ncbi:hypothetical protein O181_054016 [Austropuccinia psidii MF-1]|uniref:Integrase catalytic domain-containing protein n=1 Tax=Austropuccinia psidii MF-1 TaxID=1389203 RepID=A0A9Q3HQQ1_9BASI|nr:hypothetical protein [Austropuccinia psidii MF-1]